MEDELIGSRVATSFEEGLDFRERVFSLDGIERKKRQKKKRSKQSRGSRRRREQRREGGTDPAVVDF